MRPFVAPDVNGPRLYHPRNEPILEANFHSFRQIFRDIEFTVLSGEQARTSGRYGIEPRQGPRLPAMVDPSLVPALTPGAQCGVTVSANIRF